MRFLPWRPLLLVIAMLVVQGATMYGQGSDKGDVSQIVQGGLAALKQNRFDEAITAFRKGLELAPREALTAMYLATAYSMKKDVAEALEWLSRAADWGYEDVDQIFKHPDLTFVRSQPGFTQVIEEIQSRFPASRPRRSFSTNETDRALQLVAMVRSEVGSGAAIIIGRDGQDRLLLATANHVVRKGGTAPRALEVQLKSLAPRWEKAAVLPAIEDPELDLAFIVVENIVDRDLNVCDLPLHLAGEAGRLKRGDSVFPVGYPNGILWAMPLTADRASQVFPTQVSFESQFIRVGFSGGALLDQAGEVVGMITADEPPLGRAIPLASILNAARTRQYSVLLHDPEERVSPLHAAAREGDVGALRRMLENCVDPNGANDKGRTALHEAAVHGSADAIRLLLRAGARPHAWTMIREQETEREWGTALHLAVQSGQLAAVNALLDTDEDVDFQTLRRVEDKVLERRDTPLQLAARHDHAEVAAALLAAGAAREPLVRSMMTPLETAAASGSVGVAKVLIQHGALRSVSNRNGVPSPLHYAAEAGSAEILRLLVDSGLYVNVRDDDSDTPLHKAAERGQVSAVEALLSLKADVNAEGDDFRTPLQLAAEKGKSDVVKVLLANGADPNKSIHGRVNALAIAAGHIDLESITALVAAHADIGDSLNRLLDSIDNCRNRDRPIECQTQVEAAARVLIEGGADLRLKTRSGAQPIHLAAAIGLANTVTLLVERGAPLTIGTEGDNATPLHLAASKGHVEVVRRLIAAKVPINQQDGGGSTALYRAVDEKQVNVVNVLLQSGADPNIGNRIYHGTPVLEAASSSAEILALLLKAGGNPNSSFAESRVTALHRAARERNAEAVRLLLQAGAKASADNEARWPLHVAIRSGGSQDTEKSQLAIIELLVKSGSPVDAADDERATALHLAADEGNAAAVKILLSAHARVNAVDKCGSTPLAHVLNIREESAVTVAELLLNAGAAVNVKNTCRQQTLLQMVEDRGFVTLRQLLVARGAR